MPTMSGVSFYMLSICVAVVCADSSTWAGKLLPYRSDDYNSLPHYDVAKNDASRTDDVNSILSCLVGSDVGVSLLHRHFKVFDGEAIVEQMLQNHTLAVPHNVTSSIYPYSFRLLSNGTLQPLEFAEVSPPEAALSQLANETMMSCVGQALVRMNGFDTFGLVVKHNHVGDLDPGRRTIETSSEKGRWLKVRPMSALLKTKIGKHVQSQSVTTSWFRSKNLSNGGLCYHHGGGGCFCGQCVHICNNQEHV